MNIKKTALAPGSVAALLHELEEILPNQGPLQIFIHHNTLHGFEDQEFYTGIEAAGEIHNAQVYLKESEYHQLIQAGRINATILDQHILAALPQDQLSLNQLRAALLTNNYIEHEDQLPWLLNSNYQVARINKESQGHTTATDCLPNNSAAAPANSLLSCSVLEQLTLFTKNKEPHAHYLKNLLLQCLAQTQSTLEKMNLAYGTGLNNYANKVFGINPEDHFLKICASYLDGSMATEPALNHSQNFLDYGMAHLCSVNIASNTAIDKLVANRTTLSAETFLQELLRLSFSDHATVFNPENSREILFRLALKYPGWAGAFSLRGQLFEFLCLLLIFKQTYKFTLSKPKTGKLNSLLIASRLFSLATIDSQLAADLFNNSNLATALIIKKLVTLEGRLRLRIFQQAYEDTLHASFLSVLQNSTPQTDQAVIRYNLVFCIDEREESIRRHIENASNQINTYGVAGFFGLDAKLINANGEERSICPPFVTPSKTIHCCLQQESAEKLGIFAKIQRVIFNLQLDPISTAIFALFAPILVIVTALIDRLIYKRAAASNVGKYSFNYLQSAKNPAGFTHQDIAIRLQNLLKTTRIAESPGELIVLVGHGANGANNPYKSAYDCGACGGKPGDVNTKIFAEMANLPETRSALAALGEKLPTETVFVGAYHNTTTDEFVFFDTEKLSATQQVALRELQILILNATIKNAKERSRHFASIRNTKNSKILNEVKKRAYYIAEPRPEYGHATNALCIIGPRSLSKNSFLDRRAFLVSYEPKNDPNNSILQALLKPIVPVCMGINLEYFFSAIDNYKYGAGSKLPQNVVAGCATMTGSLGDLRTGLPKQMIEIHEPVRLALLVQTSRAAIEQILAIEPLLRNPILNGWLRLFLINSETNQITAYRSEDQICVQASTNANVINQISNLKSFTDSTNPALISNPRPTK